MAFEQKDLSGSLFKNEKKQKDTDSDYQGSCKIDGKEYWINAWLKETKEQKKYFQFKFKAKG